MQDHEFGEAVRLFDQNLLQCLLHLPCDSFLDLVRSLCASAEDPESLALTRYRYISEILSEIESANLLLDETIRCGSGFPQPSEECAQAVDPHTRLIGQTAVMLGLRMTGHPVQALKAATKIEFGLNTPGLYNDHSNGWQHFVYVQHGITAMFAGDFHLALTKFAEAQMLPLSPGLECLHRNAYVRAALVHSVVGSPNRARNLLIQAQQIPRTTSWTETKLDTSIALTKVFLGAQDIPVAAQLLDSIRLDSLGEFWPFYAWAVTSVFSRSGSESEAETRLETLHALTFARSAGEGLSGSVISLLLARLALKRGDTDRANQLIASADQGYVGTMVLRAELLLAEGYMREAHQLGGKLRSEIRGLQQLDNRCAAISRTATEELSRPVDHDLAEVEARGITEGGSIPVG